MATASNIQSLGYGECQTLKEMTGGKSKYEMIMEELRKEKRNKAQQEES